MATLDDPGRPPLTEAEISAQIDAADLKPPSDEPQATSVCFHRDTRRYTMHLSNGTDISFDAVALGELQAASLEDLAAVELSPSGSLISWPTLDVDVSVDGLVMDLLGSPAWRRALRRHLNREMARTRSDARTRAARENGKKGGRPRKAARM